MGGHHNGGPPPKRDAERRRRNKPDVPTETVDLSTLFAQEVEIPVADEDWHPAARRWYDSLKRSGQARFFEPSDWATAYIVAEDLHRQLSPIPIVVTDAEGGQSVEMHDVPMNGAKLAAVLKAAASLMATEAERRRLRIEIERDRSEPVEEDSPDIVRDRRLVLVSGGG